MFDFIAIEDDMVEDDLFKEYPQFGNVPLPVTEVVDEISDCFIGCYFKGIVEAVIGRENFQFGIQHYKWLAHGFHNVFGIFPGILDFRFQQFHALHICMQTIGDFFCSRKRFGFFANSCDTM